MTPEPNSAPTSAPTSAPASELNPGPALEVKRPRRWPIYTLLGLLLVGGGVTGYISYKRAELRRYNFEPIVMPERMARVPANWSAKTLADRLEKSKKIRDEDSFEEAAEEVGLKEVLPGGYLLPPKAAHANWQRSSKRARLTRKSPSPKASPSPASPLACRKAASHRAANS